MNLTEEWRPVVGFEGLYEVSNLGRVRSLDRTVTQLANGGKSYRRRLRGASIKPQRHTGGYLTVSICGQSRLLHSVVAEAFIGPRPVGCEVCHRNGQRTDCRAENLYYGTHVENCADRKRHGTEVFGERNAAAKLNAEQIAQIRALAGVASQRAIAAQFGLSQQHVSRIVAGKRWAHV